MKLLADMGLSMTTVEALRVDGHEVVHLRDEGLHRLPDREILAKARAEGRVVLTFDLDFGDLLAAGGAAGPSVVILRVADQTPPAVTPLLRAALLECSGALDHGAIVIVEEGRCRVRHLPIQLA